MGHPMVGAESDGYHIRAGLHAWDISSNYVAGTYLVTELVLYTFEYSDQYSNDGTAIGDLNWVHEITYTDNDGNLIDHVVYFGDEWGVRDVPEAEDVIPLYIVVGRANPGPAYPERLYGFGAGWSLAFPSVEITGGTRYLHMGNGTVYEITGNSNNYCLKDYYLDDLKFSADPGYTYGNKTSTYSLRLKDGTKWYFTSSGWPLAVGNRFGDFIRFETGTVDGATRITRVHDTLGRTISFTYAANQVQVTVSKPESNAVEFYWIYTLASAGVTGCKRLSEVMPPSGPLTSYQYWAQAVQLTPVVQGLGAGAPVTFHYLNLVNITNPMGGSTSFEYSQALRKLGTDSSEPGSVDDSTIGYFRVTRRFDSGVDSTERFEESTFSYTDHSGGVIGIAWAVRTPVFTGQQGIAPASERWQFDTNHRMIYHGLTGTQGGAQRTETETVGTTYTYHGDHGQLPLAVEKTVSLSRSGSQGSTRRERTTNVWDGLGNLVSTTGPDGRTVRYTYDPTFSMLLTQFEETSANGTTHVGRLTRYTLDSAKRLIIQREQGISSFTEIPGVQVCTIPTISNIQMSTGWTWRSPANATGFHLAIKWYASGFWDDAAYTLSYRRVGDEQWIEADSFRKKGTLSSSSGTRAVDIGPLPEGQYDLNIKVLDPQISVLTGSYALGVDRLWSFVDSSKVSKEVFAYYPESQDPQAQKYQHNMASSSVYAFDGTMLSRTDYEYDPSHPSLGAYLTGVSTTVTNASGQVATLRTSAGYDTLGRMTSYSTSDGGGAASTTAYEYDLLGRLTKATLPPQSTGGQGPSLVWDYSRSPREVWKTDELGCTSIETYDGLGRFVKLELSEDAYGLACHLKAFNLYDSLGRVAAKIDGDGNRTDYAYDAFGRMIRTTHADGAVVESWIMPVGSPGSLDGVPPLPLDRPAGWPDVWVSTTAEDVVDADGQRHPVYKGYDVLGRLVWGASNPRLNPPERIPQWDRVWHRYDNLGRLIATAVQPTVDEWQITSYGYSLDGQDSHLDQPTSMSLPGNAPDYTYARDSRGLLTGEGIVGDSSGAHSIQYHYDELGRMIGASYSEGVETKRWYDKDGRLTKGEVRINGILSNSVTASYNLRGWLERETWQVGASFYELRYDYDDLGNVIRMTYPDGTVVPFSYDWAGRLEEIGGYVDSIAYNGNDAPTLVGYANGITAAYGLDTRNRIQSLQTVNPITMDTVLDLAYTFTRSGNVSSVTDAVNTTGAPIEYRYGYDAAGQLVQASILVPPATGAPELFVRYAYDGAANRISESRPGWASPVQYSYQPGNFLRLTARGNSSYSWGSYGQLTGKADGTASVFYDYDPRRLMSQAIVNGSVVESYEYDALGGGGS